MRSRDKLCRENKVNTAGQRVERLGDEWNPNIVIKEAFIA